MHPLGRGKFRAVSSELLNRLSLLLTVIITTTESKVLIVRNIVFPTGLIALHGYLVMSSLRRLMINDTKAIRMSFRIFTHF